MTMVTMNTAPGNLAGLSDVVARRFGLHFPPERWRELGRGLASAARELGFKDAQACGQWLLSATLTRPQIDILASHLTVGETYFLRDAHMFDILERHILAPLIASRTGADQRLRLWSAGCATGEEPYSIAVILNRLLPARAGWDVTILATDINPSALHAGRTGRYRSWSFRQTPPEFRTNYFAETGDGSCVIQPRFRQMVTFAYLNLADDLYPALLNNTCAVDLICCRNVLMYFSDEQRQRVIERFLRCLTDDGWLILSTAEVPNTAAPGLRTVTLDGLTLYRKAPAARAAAEQPAWGAASASSAPPARPVAAHASPPAPTPAADCACAEQCCAAGQYVAAANVLTRLLARVPEYPPAILLMARTCANQGHLTDARRWIERAAELDKLNPAIHYFWSTILQEEGHLPACRAALRRALYLNPHFILAHFMLGSLAFQQGDAHMSGQHFDTVLALLDTMADTDVVPESDGLTAARLRQIVAGMAPRRAPA
ncbi:MAG: tetratricopeptide repeat protein [Lentisphaerae bacterium]|nr:tetratricopeptide repeat protein [Lentisphaerota bacterium]